jgi:hypothetical protein
MNPTETRKEVLMIKTTIHDIMNKMIRVCILSSLLPTVSFSKFYLSPKLVLMEANIVS